MRAGARVRFNENCPWPGRVGCVGTVVHPPRSGRRFPKPGPRHVLVLLDEDPIGPKRSETRGWSCVAHEDALDEVLA